MPISWKLQEMIVAGTAGQEIRRQAIVEQMLTLRDAAMRKLKLGSTTLEEVIRETVSD
jgi:type II secretory ATPase GspE/PulE/Tfp pilus assembly ATPase PilB-like protein